MQIKQPFCAKYMINQSKLRMYMYINLIVFMLSPNSMLNRSPCPREVHTHKACLSEVCNFAKINHYFSTLRGNSNL